MVVVVAAVVHREEAHVWRIRGFNIQQPTRTVQPRIVKSPPSSRRGQAMVELMVSLVAILALTGGLLLIVSFGTARTRAMMEARKEAGVLSMLDLTPIDMPEFIQDWDAGADGKDLTADDEARRGSHTPFNDFIVEQAAADADAWGVLSSVNRNGLPPMRDHPTPITAFGMVKGDAHDSVRLLSVVQHLFYAGDSIDIDTEVWLTHTRGIY